MGQKGPKARRVKLAQLDLQGPSVPQGLRERLALLGKTVPLVRQVHRVKSAPLVQRVCRVSRVPLVLLVPLVLQGLAETMVLALRFLGVIRTKRRLDKRILLETLEMRIWCRATYTFGLRLKTIGTMLEIFKDRRAILVPRVQWVQRDQQVQRGHKVHRAYRVHKARKARKARLEHKDRRVTQVMPQLF